MGDAREFIGIFDSGVGGLTVLRQVAGRLPHESILYLGDTARVPYGTKSPETVIRYARACAGVLLARGIKLLIVACNTASAFAIDTLRDDLEIPVLGVIEPGARAAVARTKSGRIGVIGTSGTVASRAYPDTIAALDPKARVYGAACPLFVPLAEEGWTRGETPRLIAQKYLRGLLRKNIDTLVLGCTHYPLLSHVIGETAGKAVRLVDSAEETAKTAAETLRALDKLAPSGTPPVYRYLVSDSPGSFTKTGKRFLGRDLGPVEWVDF